MCVCMSVLVVYNVLLRLFWCGVIMLMIKWIHFLLFIIKAFPRSFLCSVQIAWQFALLLPLSASLSLSLFSNMRQSHDHRVTVWRSMVSKGLKEDKINYTLSNCQYRTCVKCYNTVLLIISAQAVRPNFKANLNLKLERWHPPKLVCIHVSH